VFVKSIGLVGAGTMGASIATALALAGFTVKLKEVDDTALQRGLRNIEDLFKKMVAKGLPEKEALNQCHLIESTRSYAELQDAEIVIEAVVEDITEKRSVFEELDRYCLKECILASNTSSLSITQLASFTQRADRVVGLHFFNPAHIMKLVEVVPGLCTSDETVQRAIAFGTKLNKLAIRVDDCPSFLINRLLSRYLTEAIWLLQGKKASVESIDDAARKLLMPIGPFALRDMNGLDVGLAVARLNFREYGERFRPPALLERMVEEKMLGRKTSAGFYTYDRESRRADGVNPEVLKLLDLNGSDELPHTTAEDSMRLFLPMINEAFIALQEKICALEDVDTACRAGLGMREGPLQFAFRIGLPKCLEQLERLYEQEGERFRPAPLLKRFVWAGRTSLT